MNLNPDQFGALYHGTGAVFEPGDIIEPRDSPMRGGPPRAFASKHQEMAVTYARYVNMPEGGERPTHGHVYEVEPVDPDDVHHMQYEATSTKGFRVKRRLSSHPVLDEKD